MAKNIEDYSTLKEVFSSSKTVFPFQAVTFRQKSRKEYYHRDYITFANKHLKDFVWVCYHCSLNKKAGIDSCCA